MGGDNAPLEIVKGAIESKKKLNIIPILVGDKNKIEACLKELEFTDKIEIVDAQTVIENDEEPTLALRRKKDSSLVIGLNLLKEGKGDGFISAGSTGALLAGGLFIIKRIDGIKRAPIAALLPTKTNNTILVDTGANTDCSPEMLHQFGILGSIYMEEILGIENPSVGLLNIGSEEGKGNSLTKEAYELIKKEKSINFIGNIEARDVPFGKVDVLIADGFDGNILLKNYEGTALMIGEMLKEEIGKVENKEAALEFSKILSKTFSIFNYENHGAAPLLGLQKPVFKAHGISNSQAIVSATRQVCLYIKNNVNETIINSI